MGRRRKKHKKDRLDEEKRPVFDISQETQNSIWGIFSFIIAILSILGFMGMAGRAGDMFSAISKSLFGWGFFIIPIAFILLGASFIKSISRRIHVSAIFGTVLFSLSILALFFIIGSGDLNDRIIQGGYLGVIMGFPLLASVGFTASLIILIALIFVAFLVTLNIPIYRLIKKDEDEENEELKDNIVVKKDGKVVDDTSGEAKRSSVMPAAFTRTPISKPVREISLTDKEFSIKNIKSGKWVLPPIELLHGDEDQPTTGDINAHANIIKRTLSNFSIDVEMGEVSIGPTVTQFTLRPAVGVRLSRISALNPDLSLALAAHPIRIEAPIPGKSLVGIEVPNKKVAVVGLRNMLDDDGYKKSKYFLPMALGRDVSGSSVFSGIEKMPHLLIAGATGTGKSVTINTILLSMLYRHSPDVLKLILIDPKRVELTPYNGIPHLITPVITDGKKVVGALRWSISEMERRFDVLSQKSARDIFSYNAKMVAEKKEIMPFLVIVIDELADLMAAYGRDVEAAIVRLAQMSRAVGIHLIVSTQRPSVEVITGLIKANITSRIALQVASQIDSRTILDMAGAEKLLGNGDMLYMAGDTGKPRRLQGSLVSEKEVKDVVKFIKMQAEKNEDPEGIEEMQVDFASSSNTQGLGGSDNDADDALYGDAKEVVVLAGKASASLLQRRLRVGYARAARLLDILEEKGVIGPGDGAKARDVYVKPEGAGQVETGMNADTIEVERTEV
jgi:DNA segregation ATPase FtsK/SpoIIIE, S-DNA-T family